MPDSSAPTLDNIRTLVDAFRDRAAELRGPQKTEAEIRSEFIDPFWNALGWDIRNRAHKSDAEKDVVIEAHVGTIEEGRRRSRRSDYLFRIGGFPRFFVEAKKPAVDLVLDKDALFQAKTYAWNAQIPFAIAMDFEEFRLFDTKLKPYYNDPEAGRIAEFDLRFDDFVAQWDVLLETFGREAVAGGSLERLLAKIKKVRKGRRIRGFDRMLFDLKGSEPVDRVFLAHLEDYRLRFARDLYSQNRSEFPDADTRHGAAKLTEAVGRLIDRFVFIRVCEDRDIVPYGTLRDTIAQANNQRVELYPLLVREFRSFDRAYNGYLFKTHFSEHLTVSPQLLGDFLRSLYQPDSPYRFDVISDDLLGIIYERFLGSVISVKGKQVSQEEKPEVRHAGGVYYTPKFVVDSIIRRVVGPKIKGKSPRDVLDVKILDPACGSGSFLIAAFQTLIDHCIDYITNKPQAAEQPRKRGSKKKREIAFQGAEGKWQLTPEFNGELLTSCIHGVDIDPQAVEVTIMSLYIKAMEGDIPKEHLQMQVLPDLVNNIRCGNSLIAPDDFDLYWEEQHGNLFGGDPELEFRINPFDWQSATHGFGRVLNDRDVFDAGRAGGEDGAELFVPRVLVDLRSI